MRDILIFILISSLRTLSVFLFCSIVATFLAASVTVCLFHFLRSVFFFSCDVLQSFDKRSISTCIALVVWLVEVLVEFLLELPFTPLIAFFVRFHVACVALIVQHRPLLLPLPRLLGRPGPPRELTLRSSQTIYLPGGRRWEERLDFEPQEFNSNKNCFQLKQLLCSKDGNVSYYVSSEKRKVLVYVWSCPQRYHL